MMLLTIVSIEDEKWSDTVVALLAEQFVRVEDGDNDYIAVVMNARLCHHDMFFGTQDKGIHFPNNFAEEAQDVLDAFRRVEAVRNQKNAEQANAVMPKHAK